MKKPSLSNLRLQPGHLRCHGPSATPDALCRTGFQCGPEYLTFNYSRVAREAGTYVIGAGRAAGGQTALDFGAQEFVDLENDALEAVGGAATCTAINTPRNDHRRKPAATGALPALPVTEIRHAVN